MYVCVCIYIRCTQRIQRSSTPRRQYTRSSAHSAQAHMLHFFYFFIRQCTRSSARSAHAHMLQFFLLCSKVHDFWDGLSERASAMARAKSASSVTGLPLSRARALSLSLSLFLSLSLSLHTHTQTQTHTNTHTHTHTCIHTLYICISHTHTHAYTHTWTHSYIRTGWPGTISVVQYSEGGNGQMKSVLVDGQHRLGMYVYKYMYMYMYMYK